MDTSSPGWLGDGPTAGAFDEPGGKAVLEATAAEHRPRTRRWRDGEVALNPSAWPAIVVALPAILK